ncbi:uncharacterized protein LOC109855459 isoform X2 [Pseudomyrmex gracilis]|uniref:uncharacterized protein LOC109855459 isoform X2 n=1 Tax=Pseudomyrmex gracilis TaxID=219809 RepID=UPI000995D270|nr:uncharacterized protein LOC109855459 isoform X2 [Pseudomyrmex gracilis]
MSNSPGPSRGVNAHVDASFNDKPSYVRRLNFGQSILDLDTVEQCHNRVVVVDESVTRIPCTVKTEYVRKWIETHGGDTEDDAMRKNSGDASRLSPVLGTLATSVVSAKSPILGGSGKRRKGKIRINRHATVKKTNNQDCWETGERFAMNFESDCENKEEENKTERKEIQRTPSCEKNVATDDELSPVLGTHQHRKRKRRKLQRDDPSAIPQREANNNCCVVRDVSAIDEMKGSENAGVASEVTTSPMICQKYQGTFTSAEERLNLQDSSSSNTDRRNPNIEVSPSENSRDEDEGCNKLSDSNTNSNNSLSNFIEDVNTQKTTQVIQSSQLTANDLDETYCSKAEMMLENTRLSAQISQVTSMNRATQKTGSKLTQTDHISSITTPSKKSPDKSMYAYLLDSGKKRQKPKKGSMVSRLQSLVNAQVSDIRIWRHQMSKNQDAAVQFVSVFVRSCRKQFGNQFLDGILLEDRFNLLQTNEKIEETNSNNTQIRSKQTPYKNITIMLVCDIVDRNDLTLEVTYISISDDNVVPDVANRSNSHERPKRIVKEFNCPCIEEERELPFCSRKPSNDKPDVMEKIFEF